MWKVPIDDISKRIVMVLIHPMERRSRAHVHELAVHVRIVVIRKLEESKINLNELDD